MIKWIYSNYFVMPNMNMFIIFVISMVLIILTTIVLVNLELKREKNDNK